MDDYWSGVELIQKNAPPGLDSTENSEKAKSLKYFITLKYLQNIARKPVGKFISAKLLDCIGGFD